MDSKGQAAQKKGKKPAVKKVTPKTEVKKTITETKKIITLEMIAKKAYELYEKRGCQPGFEAQDWFEAKKILEAGNEKKGATS